MPHRSWVLAALLSGACSVTLNPKATGGTEPGADAGADTGAVVPDSETSEDTAAPADAGKCGGTSPCLTLGECAKAQPFCTEEAGWDCAYPATHGDELCDTLDNDCDGDTDESVRTDSDPACSPTGVCGSGAPSRCYGGAMVCQYDEVGADWEAVETLCDGKDNDCNGQTDEMVGPSLDCLKAGVCAFGTATCNGTSFTCVYPPQYEKLEASCDGLDNDCDDSTDEAGVKDTSGTACPSLGVCEAAAGQAACTGGKWACPAIVAPGYETKEKSCDGQDNDCDGQTDEGTNVTAEACPDASKALLGVCKGATLAVCAKGKAACDFESVPGYEPAEASCDGKDNDCDGETDEGLTAAPLGTCKSVGECSFGVTASCENGLWVCKYGNAAYQAGTETACDAKDNDCDGLTDEALLGDAAACAAKGGVCALGGAKATCQAGQTVCDFSGVLSYEPLEASCDGLDNDCDGVTDGAGLPFNLFSSSNTCKKKGVCAETTKTFAKCVDGEWACDYAAVAEFQAEPESKCDGLDNDCDGLVDEDIVVTAGSGCKSVGVCEGKVAAHCIGKDKYACEYADLVGFENPEVSCDGKDNNCDGATDEGVCPLHSKCEIGEQCLSGICKPSPDPELSFCVADVDHCPGDGGEVDFALDQKSCVLVAGAGGEESWYDTTCKQGGWVKGAAPCIGNACIDGKCTDCVPNTFKCSSDGQSTSGCTADGKIENPVLCPTTPQATTCTVGGKGICLLHAETPLDNGGVNQEPAVAVGTTGLLAVAWHKVGTPLYVGASRRLDAYGRPGVTGPTPQILASPSGSKDARRLDVAILDAQHMVLTWQEVTTGAGADDGNVKFRVQNYLDGKFPAGTGVNSVPLLSTLEQSWPRVAVRRVGMTSPSVVITWQSLAACGGPDCGFDVFVKTWGSIPTDSAPKSPSGEVQVNLGTQGQQERPVVEELADGQIVVGYQDQSADIGTYGVYARLFTGDLTSGSATAVQLNGTSMGEQTDLALAQRKAGGFVAAWTSTQAGNKDVYARLFDAKGAPIGAEVLISRTAQGTSKPGDQARPDVAAFPNGTIVVVYEDGAADASGTAVLYRQLDASLGAFDKEIQVNEVNVQGDQRHARIVAAGSAERPWFEVVFESVDPSGSPSGIYGRPFELK